MASPTSVAPPLSGGGVSQVGGNVSQPQQLPPPQPVGAAPSPQSASSFTEGTPPVDAPEDLGDERERWLKFAREEFERIVAEIDAERQQRYVEVRHLESQIEELQETSDLQDVGLIFSGDHPLAASVEYKAVIDEARSRRKAFVKQKQAVTGNKTWAVAGDSKDGQRLVDEISKLMLRAYNNELDAIVKATNATNVDKKLDALGKKRQQIHKLGARMGLEINPMYHDLAVYEVRQVGRFAAAKLVEKEKERERKEQLREEKKVAEEIAREQAKLDKEHTQYEDALQRLKERPDASVEEIAELEAKLVQVAEARDDVTLRAANTRAGHVYVISNPGSFGNRMVKIGMTRRLNPQERVDELGDASVPFRYSVHALIFSDDAVGLETELHHIFEDRRVNKVNRRREFFYVTPAEVREALVGLDAHMLEFDEVPVNEEWEASQ